MPTIIQRSFAGGEIAPALWGRADQVKFQTGLKTCRNFLVQRYGGVTNRPGTEFIGEVEDSANRSRLVPFVYNADQTYVLEFGDLTLRVIRAGAYVESSPGVIYQIASPFAVADLPRLKVVQSADVLTLTHPSYAPRRLSRTGHAAWAFATINFVPAIGTPTGLNVTAGGAGANTYKYRVTAVSADGSSEESLPTAIFTLAAAAVPTTAAPHVLTWSAVAGASQYNVYKGSNDVYGYIGTAGALTFNDTNIAPETSYTPPADPGIFASAGNYPATAAYYQQRLLFASTTNAPEDVWASRIGNFTNYTTSTPLQSDDAISFTLAGRQVNAVRHLVEAGKLVVLTAGGEWTMEGDSNGAITPAAINPRARGYNGAAEQPAPVVVTDSLIYVQARGSIVRDLTVDDNVGGYRNRDLTIFAPHLFDTYQIEEMAFAQIPHSVVWAVRNDGTLLGLTYLREQELWGWHRHDSDGDAFESVACVPEGDEDAVYVIVRRTVNGATRRYVERFTSRQESDLALACFLDSSLAYDGTNTGGTTLTVTGGTTWASTEDLTLTASASTFVAGDVGNRYILTSGDDSVELQVLSYTSATVVTVRGITNVAAALRSTALATWARAVDQVGGLDHLEGRTVGILGDGLVVSDGIHGNLFTVTGGLVDLPRPYTKIRVGLPITADLVTLDVETPDGATLIERKKRVNRVSLLVEGSRGIFAGPDADHLREYKQRTTEAMGQPTRATTGVIEIPITANWNTSGSVTVRQTNPLPLTVLSIAPGGDIGG